jgi:hypothetical protein
VHTNDVAQITVPPEDNAEHAVAFVERHVIGDRDRRMTIRLTGRRTASQNQALETDCFNHLSRRPRIARPRLFDALRFARYCFGMTTDMQPLWDADRELAQSIFQSAKEQPVQPPRAPDKPISNKQWCYTRSDRKIELSWLSPGTGGEKS